jgi:type I restriction enzyme S subunit
LSQGVPFLSVKNVRPFRIFDSDIKHISPEEHREINKRCNPELGDILYTKVGATFGYAAANTLNYPFSLFVSVALIKPIFECLCSEYAEMVLNSEIVFSQARDRVSGSGTPDLHLIEIRDFRIPVPTLTEQHEIVRRVKGLFALADTIEKHLLAATVRVENLAEAILAKAFRGELVPTEAELARREGRSYESGAELLARIRAGRSVENGTRQKKRHTKSPQKVETKA